METVNTDTNTKKYYITAISLNIGGAIISLPLVLCLGIHMISYICVDIYKARPIKSDSIYAALLGLAIIGAIIWSFSTTLQNKKRALNLLNSLPLIKGTFVKYTLETVESEVFEYAAYKKCVAPGNWRKKYRTLASIWVQTDAELMQIYYPYYEMQQFLLPGDIVNIKVSGEEVIIISTEKTQMDIGMRQGMLNKAVEQTRNYTETKKKNKIKPIYWLIYGAIILLAIIFKAWILSL